MEKRLLILQACGIPGEELEINNIENHAQLYGIIVDKHCPKTSAELETILYKFDGIAYDYIYLSSHGDDRGFANHNCSLNVSWREFGIMLCASGCMKENSIVMLSCCRGGLNQVAYQLFYQCNHINYVVGPRQSLPPVEMMICFNLLLFNIEHRGVDPLVACEKIKNGTDTRFVCFDIMETEGDFGFISFQQEQQEIEEAEKLEKENIATQQLKEIIHSA
jgi:hypothetical protein